VFLQAATVRRHMNNGRLIGAVACECQL
jgi:hypothetical protein